jgi:hypothetical protein
LECASPDETARLGALVYERDSQGRFHP